MLFEVHGRLVLRNDDTDLLTGTEFLEFGCYGGKIAVPGQDKGGIKSISHGVGKQSNGNVYIRFLLFVRLITAFAKKTFPFSEGEFAQNILYPYGTESMNIKQMLLSPVRYPCCKCRKVINSVDFLGLGINDAFG
jgi:hypothetical protein